VEKVGVILLNTLKRSGFEKKIMEARLFLSYDSIVGEKIAAVSKPTFFRDRTLFIGVASPAWSQQLHFLKPEIIEKINSQFSYPIVKDIKFHICKITPPCSGGRAQVKKEPAPRISDKKREMVYNISSEIKDRELREKFAELMLKDLEFKLKKGEGSCSST
jgi:hypothetical protein